MIVSEITNHPEVLAAIEVYHRVRTDVEIQIAILNTELKPYLGRLKELVNAKGGYDQDGIKAYFEKRHSYEYKPELVKVILRSDLAKVCIVEAVNAKALEGLQKGKLITELELLQCAELTKTTEAFVCPLPKAKAEAKDATTEG